MNSAGANRCITVAILATAVRNGVWLAGGRLAHTRVASSCFASVAAPCTARAGHWTALLAVAMSKC